MMVPPVRHGKPAGASAVADEAPLQYWQIMASFDTASDCESYKAWAKKKNENRTDISKALKAEFLTFDKYADCIASDDPRLKGD